MNILKVNNIVKKILIENPECRDDDQLLILKVWGEQEPHLRDSRYSFIMFAQNFINRKFYSTESICRVRRKLQEEFGYLRGKKHKNRHNHQKEIKKQLKSLELLSGGTP